MSDIQKRNRANKQKGSKWQSDIRDFFREHGLSIEILNRTGARDEGDLVVRSMDPAVAFLVEAKNEQRINLSSYMAEANIEAQHYVEHRVNDVNLPTLVIPCAAVKRRNTSTGKAYIVLEAEHLAKLLLYISAR
jgi:hypothetical protein